MLERIPIHNGLHTIDRIYYRALNRRKRRRETTEISCCLKYFMFTYNFVFMFLGFILICSSVWAWSEKEIFSNSQSSRIFVDPVLILCVSGILMFTIGFFGTFGSLRENTVLLLIFCLLIGAIFLAEILIIILAFVNKKWLLDRLKSSLKLIVRSYRFNVDLRDFVDWIQSEWLHCCGIDGPSSWEANPYFNCNSPSAEKCGVPPSCCRPQNGVDLRNIICGRHIRHQSQLGMQNKRIYTLGCLSAGQKWVEDNILAVSASLVVLAVLQVVSICLAQNLRGDIFAQRARWLRPPQEVY